MNPSLLLDTKNLVYTLPHQEQRILPMDISLKGGEITIFTGVSGSGKTCFLDALQGQIPLFGGIINHEAATVRIYQDLRLVREHSALRNVLDGLVGKRKLLSALWPHEKDRAKALFWLKRVGLQHKALQPVFSLSAGEAQRVAIARAMMAEPLILLADEPFSSLDDNNAQMVMSLFEKECRERGMTALIVTHKVPHLNGITPVHLLPFNPKVDPSNQAVEVKEQALPLSMPNISSRRGAAAGVFVLFLLSALWLLPELSMGNFSWNMLGNFFLRWIPSPEELANMPWQLIFVGIADTLAMASLATLVAIFFSLPIAMIASRGFMPDIVVLPVRYALNWWRAIPSIIWALVCVSAVGLGTLSGLLALMLYSMGYLTKFFYECFEQVDRKPAQSLAQLGAGRSQIVALALWPMTIRSVLSSSLFMFEYNVRAASILGIVGAGGIGVLLKESVEWSNWHVVAIIIFLMGFMVIAIDGFSSWLRRSLTPERRHRGSG
ncbi:MAG: ATP-binding cassette domain-containing protein [Holosporales bacterium]